MSECWCQIFSPSPPFNLISGVTQTSRGWIDLHEELTNLCWQSVATLLSDITEPSHVPSWGTTTHATFLQNCNFKTQKLVTRCESTSSSRCVMSVMWIVVFWSFNSFKGVNRLLSDNNSDTDLQQWESEGVWSQVLYSAYSFFSTVTRRQPTMDGLNILSENELCHVNISIISVTCIDLWVLFMFSAGQTQSHWLSPP